MKILQAITLLIAASAVSTIANAWDGTDVKTGNAVEIEQGNLVRSGETIDYVDQDSGETRQGEVQDITRSSGSVDVEIIDQDSGESKTLEMDPNE